MSDYDPWIKLYFIMGQYDVKFASSPIWTEFWESPIEWQTLIDKGYCVHGADSKFDFTQKFIDEVVNG